MRKKCFTLLFCLICLGALSQNKNFELISRFKYFYNSSQYKELVDIFSTSFDKSQLKEFFIDLKESSGIITEYNYLSSKEGLHTYKFSFNKNIYKIDFKFDNNYIVYFLVEPYRERLVIKNIEGIPISISAAISSRFSDTPNNTQISIGVVNGGITNFYGVLVNSGKLESVKNKSKIFEIGSITKVFTATVLADMLVKKQINLSDSVNNYYSFPFKGNQKLTFQSLANHTSGLLRLPSNLPVLDTENPYKLYGKESLEFYLKNSLQIDNPGSYAYSNLGVGLLGHTLGKIHKTSFQKLLKQSVFEKLKMNHTFINSKTLNLELVKGLNAEGEQVSNWDFDALFACGGILSCTDDMMKFVKAHLSSKNIPFMLTRQESFKINENVSVGLGWHILNRKGDKYFFHNGGLEAIVLLLLLTLKRE